MAKATSKGKSKAHPSVQPVPSAPPTQSMEIADESKIPRYSLRNRSRATPKSISKAHSTGKKSTASAPAPPRSHVQESETGESSGYNRRRSSLRSSDQPSPSKSTLAPAAKPAETEGNSSNIRSRKRKAASPEYSVARKRGRPTRTTQPTVASSSAGPSRQQPESAPRQTRITREEKIREFKQEEKVYQKELEEIQQQVSELHVRLGERHEERREIATVISDCYDEIVRCQRYVVELDNGYRQDYKDTLDEAKQRLNRHFDMDRRLRPRIQKVLFHLDSLVAKYNENFAKLETAMDMQLLLDI
ncbi:hypothetical protein F53441_12936 [Fusarium austroafricanum]|uniref:Uncharacterized protein n=1 Tax=Fusarium austroafricanum TaxID=2364996 RepID=A0A8H4JT01_9HYPO|nr:hypothetical protein F53441_12936 [Fusarium austroafricanum]